MDGKLAEEVEAISMYEVSETIYFNFFESLNYL